jgi:hypothetical protein
MEKNKNGEIVLLLFGSAARTGLALSSKFAEVIGAVSLCGLAPAFMTEHGSRRKLGLLNEILSESLGRPKQFMASAGAALG